MRLYPDASLRTDLLTLTGLVVLLSVLAAVELGRDAIVPVGRVAAVVIGVLWLGAAFLIRHPGITNALQTATGIAAVCIFVGAFLFIDDPSAVVRLLLVIPITAVVTALGVLAEALTVPGLVVFIAIIVFSILQSGSPG